MNSLAAPNTSAPLSRLVAWRAASEIGLIFLIFFIHGAWLAPDVNEPHYLSKARHYWDPSWCANDFFCNTADAHQAFYWTFGWLSRWMSPQAMAWCGRLLTWGPLACAWRRLSLAIVPAPLYAVLSAAIFVALNSHFQMAGEWIIGGIEAKGFAYVLILLGLERAVRNRLDHAVLLFGAASSFHVILGGWSVIAAGAAWLTSPSRQPLKQLILPLAGGLLLALPGLLPALALTRHVDPEVVRQANQIYVYERLYHHLVPQTFPSVFVARHLALIGVWLVLVSCWPLDDAQKRLRGFVGGAIGISLAGFLISVTVPTGSDLAAGLLRYYWFRLGDVMVPLGVALMADAILFSWQTWRRRWYVLSLGTTIVLLMASFGDTIVRRHRFARPPADASIVNLAAWREACAWIAANTPEDALFLTPRLAQTFRWYAGRSEVVSRKDVPQDAPGIAEWWRRMIRIHGAEPGSANLWRDSLAELGSARLKELGAEFKAQYAVTPPYPPLNLERVGPINGSFAIYRLSEEPGSDKKPSRSDPSKP